MEPLILLLVFITTRAAESNGSLSCPLWHYREQGECKCGNSLHRAVICSEDQIYLKVDYTMDVWHNVTVVAMSRWAYHNFSAIPRHLRVYSLIPKNTPQQDLNELMCRKNNRKGFLCGECLPKYGPSAYSPRCHRCDRSVVSAIALYLTVKLLPVAILFIVITTFHINVIRGPMLGYIFFCQAHVIIHAFASLIFLSFASLNYNTYQLLSSTSIYVANSTSPLMTYVVFDHKDMHVYTPRYIIPLLLLFFLGVLPSLLLLLYPIRMFRVRLRRCCSHRWLIRLNTFVETFQGPFKDGCNGTRDYRIIPGILGCVILLLNTFSCLIHGSNCDNYLIVTFALVFAFSSVLSAYIKPCKSSCANLSLTFHLMMMVSATIILTLWRQDLDMDKTVLVSLFTVVVAIPHIVMFLWVCYKIQKKFGLRQRFLMWFSFTTGRAYFSIPTAP